MRILLVIGLGDVAQRALPALLRQYGRGHVFALVRHSGRHGLWARRGLRLIRGDLSRPTTLKLLAGLATDVIHFAPPPAAGRRDTHTRNLLAALVPQKTKRLVYISTSGVYGDCGGAVVTESRPVNPQNARAVRRADAERTLLRWGRRHHSAVSILRVPGIYASERLPLARLRAGTPALCAAEDVYTSHIHADDLAAIAVTALRRARGLRIYNAADDTRLRMGDYFDLVADSFGLPRPARVSRIEAMEKLSPVLRSFMSESRQLDNGRMKRALAVRLRYPTVVDFLNIMKEH